MSTVVTSREAAQLLRIEPQTLRCWRLKGTGPRFIRFGAKKGRVVYDLSDIEAWLAGRKFQSTSEESATAGS